MARKFLTAEDVRHAGSKEIVVDTETIVTPQAQEAARAAGAVIRTAQGAYAEPKPDRGPDADRAMRSLPHLPEPDAEDASGAGVIVTAVGKNRAGVLAELTGALAAAGVSVHDISQRVV